MGTIGLEWPVRCMGVVYAGCPVCSGCGRSVNGGKITDYNHCTMQIGNVPTARREKCRADYSP